jgi:hypothetical protein
MRPSETTSTVTNFGHTHWAATTAVFVIRCETLMFSGRVMQAMTDDRKEFLGKMHDQMFNDINTHILVVWQSVGVVVGAFAVFSLVEKNVIPVDFACSLMILLSAWLIAHLYDASNWYNRNLAIIANIEGQFLKESDLKDIHYYFGKHREKSKMLTHLKIQYALAIGVAGLFLSYHFALRVVPGLRQPIGNFQFTRSLP